jgi:hypothetical protein
MTRLLRSLLVGLPAAVVAVAGQGVAASAAPVPQTVNIAFWYEGQAHYTVTDQAPADCQGTHTDQTETGDVSWKTTYAQPITVRTANGQAAFTVKGTPAPGDLRHWSYTGSSPGCKDWPAAHVHCQSDDVDVSAPAGFGGQPRPEIKVEENTDGIKITQVQAIAQDFFISDITGTAGVCTLNPDANAMDVPLNMGVKIADLFSVEDVQISSVDLRQLATGKVTDVIHVDDPTSLPTVSCVDSTHPSCDLDVDLGPGKIIIEKK